MPNFKIIQDVADQARIKIYGSQDVALNTDAGGNMSVTPPANGLTVTAPASGLSVTPPTAGFSITPPTGGLSITPPTGGLSVTAPANGLTVTAPASGLSVTPPTGGLSITPPTGGLSVTAPANGLTVTAPASGLSVTPPTSGFSVTAPTNGLTVTAPASGLSVTPPTGGLSITPPTNGLLITSTGLSVISALATTDVSEVRANITDTTGSADTTFTVISVKDWSFGLVNNSLATNAQLTARLQLSPDGTTWFNDGAVVTLNINTANALVPGIFLKYARVFYAAVNAASAITLNIFFQGQS